MTIKTYAWSYVVQIQIQAVRIDFFSVLHVSLNVAKLAMELMVEIPEGGQLQIMTVLPNVDSALYVMEM